MNDRKDKIIKKKRLEKKLKKISVIYLIKIKKSFKQLLLNTIVKQKRLRQLLHPVEKMAKQILELAEENEFNGRGSGFQNCCLRLK